MKKKNPNKIKTLKILNIIKIIKIIIKEMCQVWQKIGARKTSESNYTCKFANRYHN